MSSASSQTDRGPLLGALLRIVAHTNGERLAQWLASGSFNDLQPAHAAAIQPLWELPDGARITALARMARITKQSMSALVDHLEATGYAERTVDPADARATLVRLTARGRAYGRAVRAFAREVEVDWEQRIGAKHVAALRTALTLLRESLLASDTSGKE